MILAALKKYMLLLLLTAGFFLPVSAQKKKWKAVIACDGYTRKGILLSVTDSSAFIAEKNNPDREVLFRDMNRIKVIPKRDKGAEMIVGANILGLGAGIFGGMALAAKKEGEPAAISGVVGGIAFGIVGSGVGALLAPAVVDVFVTRRFKVEQDAASWQQLKEKLAKYCLRR